jgi:hypothetical protein
MGVPVGVVRAREGEKAPIDQPVQIAVLHRFKVLVLVEVEGVEVEKVAGSRFVEAFQAI